METISYLSSNSGADIIVEAGGDSILSAELFDPLLQSYASDVKDFVYMTEDLQTQLPGTAASLYMEHATKANTK